MEADVKAQENGTGRFPAPRERWITDQLPEGLMKFFGFRNEPMPDRFHDEVNYTYRIKYPDDSPYELPILARYLTDGIPAAFIIGSTVELDGEPFRVVDFRSSRYTDSTSESGPFPFVHWEVRVVPAAGGVCG
jgi:hypothetical protein